MAMRVVVTTVWYRAADRRRRPDGEAVGLLLLQVLHKKSEGENERE